MLTSSGRWFSSCERTEVNSAKAALLASSGLKTATRWQFWNASFTPKCRSNAPRIASLASARSNWPRSVSLGGGTAWSANSSPPARSSAATWLITVQA